MKDNILFWIIGIAAIFLVFTQTNIFKTESQEDFVAIKVHYYDKDMNEIFPLNSIGGFSVVPQTLKTSSNVETIDPALADDYGIVAKEDFEHNFENGLPEIPGEDIEDVPSSSSFFNNLIFQIGTFGIVTTTKTIRIDASNTDTYCYRKDSTPSYNFDPNNLNDIGSDEITGGVEVCNGLMRFHVTGLPADLASASQIQSVTLNYFTGTIYSDEGNGASTDFGLVNNLENYDWTPDNEAEEEIMFERLEKMSSTGLIFTYKFQENEENRWFSNEIGTTNVKNEIIDNKDGIPDNVLAIGIEGEYDTNDDERVDFDDEDNVNKPYIIIKYTVDTCVPETCSSLGKQCGLWSDTCGGTLSCGVPTAGFICTTEGLIEPEPAFISFEVTATNTGVVAFENVAPSSASPVEFQNALNLNDIRTLDIGQSATWFSNNITILSSWDATTIFSICVSGTNEFNGMIETKCSSIENVV